jgi:hypothetical protein
MIGTSKKGPIGPKKLEGKIILKKKPMRESRP